MNRIECSVWSNGSTGCGLKVLGGVEKRKRNFDRDHKTVQLEIDNFLFPFNMEKKRFWVSSCGELIGVELKKWIEANQLSTGDRVWLEVVESYKVFRVMRNS